MDSSEWLRNWEAIRVLHKHFKGTGTLNLTYSLGYPIWNGALFPKIKRSGCGAEVCVKALVFTTIKDFDKMTAI
jgi:hypothetical protein